jgi:hypothetical protein
MNDVERHFRNASISNGFFTRNRCGLMLWVHHVQMNVTPDSAVPHRDAPAWVGIQNMTVSTSTSNSNLGRRVFGIAALAFGLITLAWHDNQDGHYLRYVVYVAAAALIFGGAMVQFRPSAKTGAAVLGGANLVFVLLTVPGIVATPQIYNSWGNFFEQFSLLSGAAILFMRLSSAWPAQTLDRIGRTFLGICAASFALEQAFYLNPTAQLVPKWIPPSQRFWALATTVLFALAAMALLTNRMALLASRLLTIMIVGLGLLVWVPLVFSNPHSHTNWSEVAETFEIAGAAWILADLLSAYRPNGHRP